MKPLQSRGMLLSVSALILVAFSVPARSGEKGSESKGSDKAPLKAAGASERVSGVLIKVEPIKKGADSGSTISKEAKEGRARAVTHRLTINTAAVWRDWVRDQPAADPERSKRADAARGANSVATKGEPVDRDTTATVDIGPDSVVMTRYRASDDESSKGTKTPDGSKRSDAKTVDFKASDLKPGLFVEVDFQRSTAQNVATNVAVIRPAAAPKVSTDRK